MMILASSFLFFFFSFFFLIDSTVVCLFQIDFKDYLLSINPFVSHKW